MRTRTAATLTGLAVVCALLAACGPTKTPNAGGPPTGGPASAPASPAASQAASQAPAVKDVPAGNCTANTAYPPAGTVEPAGSSTVCPTEST